MRNFNDKDLDKYQKMTKKYLPNLSKYNPAKNFPFKRHISIKNISLTIILTTLGYIGYRVWQHKRYKAQHYIDLYTMKKQIANQVRWKDLMGKISGFSLKGNLKFVNEEYQRKMREGVQGIIQKLGKQAEKKSKGNNFGNQWSNQSKNRQKLSEKSHTIELVLSKDQKSQLKFSNYFSLHSKEYQTTVSNTYLYKKKNYIIPLKIFETPFFSKKRQQIKPVGKKQKLSQVIGNRGNRFNFASQCQRVNYWNIFVLGDQVQVQGKQGKYGKIQGIDGSIFKIQELKQRDASLEQNNNVSTAMSSQKQESNKRNEPTNQLKQIAKNKRQVELRKILVVQCRKKMQALEQNMMKMLKNKIDKVWQRDNKTKQSNFGLAEFSIVTQVQGQGKQQNTDDFIIDIQPLSEKKNTNNNKDKYQDKKKKKWQK